MTKTILDYYIIFLFILTFIIIIYFIFNSVKNELFDSSTEQNASVLYNFLSPKLKKKYGG